MLLPWVRRRREALRTAPFPPAWEAYLAAHVAHWAWLNDAERTRLRGDLRILIAEKSWEGANGLVLDDEIRVTIAAQASLLLLGWDEPHYFPNVTTVIVYPAGFRVRRRDREGYIETESRVGLLGEAWGNDLPVILSWDDARTGGEDAADGHNVVLHEFAHKLDLMGGGAAGVPPLPGGTTAYDTWANVMSAEFRALRRSVWFGEPSPLDGYGAQDEAEFFAVATEAFFERPERLRRERPRLYELLRGYYRQDTAARWERWKAETGPAAPAVPPAFEDEAA